MLHRANEAHTAFDLAVVGHQTAAPAPERRRGPTGYSWPERERERGREEEEEKKEREREEEGEKRDREEKSLGEGGEGKIVRRIRHNEQFRS